MKPIAFPTETVYGLGASLFDPEAIEEIFRLKGRPSDNPLIVHISSLDQVRLVAREIPESFTQLANAFFPGPLTVILPKHPDVPLCATAGLDTVGIRMPNHPTALELIDKLGPLVAPSANKSGRPSATTAAHVRNDFGEAVEVLDGGPCLIGIESTVLALMPKPVIYRPGAISPEEIEAVLGEPVPFYRGELAATPSPGMKHRHYAPEAKVRLFKTRQELEASLREEPDLKRVILDSVRGETLYAELRAADQVEAEEILVLCDTTLTLALRNRLERAAE